MKRLAAVHLLPFITVLALQLVLPLHVETSTNGNRRERAASEPGGGCPFRFAEEGFACSIRDSVDRLSLEHRPLLVHTRNEDGVDSLVFLREGEDKNYTFPLHTPLYYNLKAISHLPVSVVAVVAPDLVRDSLVPSPLSPSTLQTLSELVAVLDRARGLVNEDNFPGQVGRQISIIDRTKEFIRDVNTSAMISYDVLEEFGSSLANELTGNARDAVRDYLQSLNKTVTELLTNQTISPEEYGNLSVVIEIPPFVEPNSFILQYYERLLNYRYQSETQDPGRIVLSPSPLSGQESDFKNTTTTNAFSATELTHAITRTFYGANEVFSSTHGPLSQAAGEIICSPDLSFPSCIEDRNGNTREEKLPPGFGNPTERGYVAAIIFISAFCVVLMIIVVCIFREGKVMRIERRKEDPLMSRKPNEIGGRINDGSGSDEEEDEVQVISNRGASLEENRDTVEPVTTTRTGAGSRVAGD